MKNGLSFLVAAKRCEIAELQHLALTCELVGVIARLVHGLQRERGLTNLFLGSAGIRMAAQREQQIESSRQLELELLTRFDQLDTDVSRIGKGARLFSRIAYVLQGLDALPQLRARGDALSWTAGQATAAYSRLIASLLAVVFEAADNATDPSITRWLVAMFNFMQGKEFAGQERAVGAAAYVSGQLGVGDQQRLLHLIESQERCLQTFIEYCSGPVLALWQRTLTGSTIADLERMRRILCTAAPGRAPDPDGGQAWYDCCTRRIDDMRQVEDRLAEDLRELCQQKIALAGDDLRASQELMTTMERSAGSLQPPGMPPFFDGIADPGDIGLNSGNSLPFGGAAAGTYGPNLERSILDLVQQQAQRLQTMSTELDAARASLNERKVIERAKGLLMAHRQISEDDAHKLMRQLSMSQNRRILEVAQSVLTMAEVLPGRLS